MRCYCWTLTAVLLLGCIIVDVSAAFRAATLDIFRHTNSIPKRQRNNTNNNGNKNNNTNKKHFAIFRFSICINFVSFLFFCFSSLFTVRCGYLRASSKLETLITSVCWFLFRVCVCVCVCVPKCICVSVLSPRSLPPRQ